MSDVATCPIHEINPMLPQNLVSPWLMNKRLRDEAPVFQDPNSGIFFISRSKFMRCDCLAQNWVPSIL